jgi:fibronectin type 3 domain-containing protein
MPYATVLRKNMKRRPIVCALNKSAICLVAILALSFLLPYRVNAQAPPVPSTFQDLYTELDNYLVNFNATLPSGGGPAYPTLMTGSLKASNSNAGPALLGGYNSQSGQLQSEVQLQLNALQAMGAQAIMVQVGFPVLNQAFLTSQGQSYTDFVAYYTGIARAVRAAGMKLVVENDTLLVNSVGGGWDVAPFYQTLNWTQYQQARAQMALLIAQTMQPDYLVLMEEPDLETANSGQTNLNTPSYAASMLSQMLATVQNTGIPNVKLGAGVGTWQQQGLEYIQNYVTLPVDFIDMHIYPVNNVPGGDYLPIALQFASTAAAAGKPVSMTECWLWKVRDSELWVLTADDVRARDPFSFWAPLDALFIQTMQNLANNTQMLFMDPFNSQLYFAYLPYDETTENDTLSQIQNAENAAANTANQLAQFTSTGMSYYNSIVVPADTVPPTVPTGLTGQSGNPSTTSMSWNAATDNIGVAGYYVYRNGANIAQTGQTTFQDSGLTEAGTYTYAVQAFDLAGNLSPLSTPFTVETKDVSPPTTPENVVSQVVSCTKATFTWSPSQDNVGVTHYLVFMGLSPNSLTQVAYTAGNKTSYTANSVSPATTYYFGVEATDKGGNTSYMSPVVPVTTPTLPLAPASVSGKPASTTKIDVLWSASSGGFPIKQYLVYRGTSPSSLSFLNYTAKTSYTDLTVTGSTTYYYAIAAADTGTPPAQSGLSAPIPVTTFSGPSAPANLAATPESCTKVGLTWSPSVPDPGTSVANYRVYKGSSSSNLAQIAITSGTSYTDSKDVCGTTYYYAVQAADNAQPPDLSGVSPPVTVTTYNDPSVPANLTATAVSASKITLTWSVSTSGGLAIENYHVYAGTSPTILTQVGVATGTTYSKGSLTPGTTYYYAVSAADTAGDDSALSAPVPVTTWQLPTAPTNVVAQGNSSTQIGLSWSPSSGNGNGSIARYLILRGLSPTNLSQIGVTANTSYKDNTANPGTTYYYGVQAVDTAGDMSAVSAPVSGTTQP